MEVVYKAGILEAYEYEPLSKLLKGGLCEGSRLGIGNFDQSSYEPWFIFWIVEPYSGWT